jgi:hypothetical protein
MANLNIGPKQLLEDIKATEQKIVEIIKEVPVYITQIETKYIEVPVEKIINVIKEVPVVVEKEVEVIKTITVEVEKEVQVFKDREVEILREIKIVPKWIWITMALEFLTIVVLYFK